ncbi:MAG: type II toxin-antitoxin system RelE/ParE family toxin [Candidatus Gastranaerophilaceae bacterium]
MKEIEFFKLDNDKEPVKEWLLKLDSFTRKRIYARILRLEEENYGDFKNLGEISELRFKFGSGYRIYFAEIDNLIVLLINAGDKKTQKKDIEKAKEYLKIWKGQHDGKI